ncbi:MAG TPA: YegS/Rv2252/BmrU family lipid kinase, partial [Bacteroidia bacterium]|nr:YegS/Rv2252/BmrU family lipid kinase [Bacteroidia bacterium]
LWEHRSQKEELFRKALEGDYETVVAVGGDGTVNAVASALSGTSKKLGIIPLGSGNGLARHLGIPLDPVKALHMLGTAQTKLIDTCLLNGKTFFCTAGVGFDAHIGKLFAESRKRGMETYASMTIREIFSYIPHQYRLTVDGKEYEHDAFVVAFANAAQYGGNAFIAPLADIQDGLIDISIIKPFPILKGIPMAWRLFNKTLDRSSAVILLRGKHIVLEREKTGPVHYDGEPDIMGEKLEISIIPASLRVLVPA